MGDARGVMTLPVVVNQVSSSVVGTGVKERDGGCFVTGNNEDVDDEEPGSFVVVVVVDAEVGVARVILLLDPTETEDNHSVSVVLVLVASTIPSSRSSAPIFVCKLCHLL